MREKNTILLYFNDANEISWLKIFSNFSLKLSILNGTNILCVDKRYEMDGLLKSLFVFLAFDLLCHKIKWQFAKTSCFTIDVENNHLICFTFNTLLIADLNFSWQLFETYLK